MICIREPGAFALRWLRLQTLAAGGIPVAFLSPMKPRRTFALIVLMAGSVVVLVIVGRWRNKSESDTARAIEGPRLSGSNALTSGATALRIDGPDTSAPAVRKGTVTVERIRRMLEGIEPVMPGEVENAAALELLRWWAELEPAVAIEFAASQMKLHGRASLPAELFIAWLDRNPGEARRWSDRLPQGSLREQILPAVISMLAQHEPEVALRMAGELSVENRRAALSSLFLEWGARHPRVAAGAALQLADAREQNLALRAVLGKWMDGDMSAAIAWARNLPSDPAPGSLDVLPPVREILIEKWAAKAPADAAAYLISVPEGAGRNSLLRTVAAQWAAANPPEAMRWAMGVANETDRDVIVRGVIAAVAQTDVRAAAELALSVGEGKAEPGLALVIDQWNARDAAGLGSWVSAVSERAELRVRMPEIISTWANADVIAAERWLAQVPAGEARDLSCLALSQFWAPRDRQRALQWASAIADPMRRKQGIDFVNRR